MSKLSGNKDKIQTMQQLSQPRVMIHFPASSSLVIVAGFNGHTVKCMEPAIAATNQFVSYKNM